MSDDDSGDEMLVQLGSYEPRDAKHVIAELEKENIPFEIEADHSALSNPLRAIQLYFAMGPEGSKLIIFVLEKDLERAEKIIVERIFPV